MSPSKLQKGAGASAAGTWDAARKMKQTGWWPYANLPTGYRDGTPRRTHHQPQAFMVQFVGGQRAPLGLPVGLREHHGVGVMACRSRSYSLSACVERR